MTFVASFSVRQLRLTIVLLVVALAVTTALTILYATSGSADQTAGQTGATGSSDTHSHSDFPGSSNTHGHIDIPGSFNTHGCFRPAVPC